MPDTAFKDDLKFIYTPIGNLIDPTTNRSYPSNTTSLLSFTFISPSLLIKWHQCCTDALHCCVESLQHFDDTDADRPVCPRTWDGWSCWAQDAKPNVIMRQPCPKHIYWHQMVPPCRGYTTKECTSSGHWFNLKDNSGQEWSNYSMCARDDIYVGRIRYSIVTNVISMCTLIPALLIFGHYKQLSSVSRIRLHKHLFTSLFFHALVSCLLKWHLLTAGETQSQTSQVLTSLCLILSVLLRYFRSTTYLWMFNEALYLHQLIKHAFTQPPLTPLIILAYVLPATTTLLYIVGRAVSDGFDISSGGELMAITAFSKNLSQTMSVLHKSMTNESSVDIESSKLMEVIEEYEDVSPIVDEDKCWLMPSSNTWLEWVINAPNLAILIVNCVFLVLLLRVLCIKASSTTSTQYTNSSGGGGGGHHLSVNHTGGGSSGGLITRQSIIVSLRAAILLLPLYGLHYLFVVYRPNIESCWFSEVYHYLSSTLDGLQGCAVSIIFCFANHEIRYLLRRSLERVSTRQRSTTIYMTEVVATQQH
ncbi:calcitonin gene-related peptide type 1 receptor-like [Oppia nitens]|uniref:calcitonin gene-related peptide type 1 receptor-like n=1 Tax=Oppia nitens TaxID=1686743 RepID=UPI0023DAF171|nr:calcitonin gene-related peptide type 1 receptor-like [Oppia nitens]